MTVMDAPQTVMGRLEEIERDLAERLNEYEQAARERARFIRDWEHRFALAMRKAEGPNEGARKAHAFITAWEHDSGALFEQLSEAEAAFEASKAVIKVLETRAAIGMSVLKAQGRA